MSRREMYIDELNDELEAAKARIEELQSQIEDIARGDAQGTAAAWEQANNYMQAYQESQREIDALRKVAAVARKVLFGVSLDVTPRAENDELMTALYNALQEAVAFGTAHVPEQKMYDWEPNGPAQVTVDCAPLERATRAMLDSAGVTFGVRVGMSVAAAEAVIETDRPLTWAERAAEHEWTTNDDLNEDEHNGQPVVPARGSSSAPCEHRYWAMANVGDVCQVCGEEENHPDAPPMTSEECARFTALAEKIQETTNKMAARALVAEIRSAPLQGTR